MAEPEPTEISEMRQDFSNMQAIEQIKKELQAEKALWLLTTTRKERQESAEKVRDTERTIQKAKLLFVGGRTIRKNYQLILSLLEKEKKRDKSLCGIWNLSRFCAMHKIHIRPHMETEKKIVMEAGLQYER